jgi:molecular chaperone DnaJ
MHNAASGNLIVTVRIADNDKFERDGDNLYTAKPVGIVDAALGGEVEVDGILKGEYIKLKIPAGTQHGQVLRVRDKGMYAFRKESRGDLYVQVRVQVPEHLSRHAQDLLQELRGELSGTGSSNAESKNGATSEAPRVNQRSASAAQVKKTKSKKKKVTDRIKDALN